MNIADTLTRLDTLIPNHNPLVTLVAKEYPAHFFAILRARYKKNNPTISLITVDASVTPLTTLQEQIETSFLGMRRYVWLHNIHATTTAESARLLAYLFAYTGPNTVIAIFSEPTQLQQHKQREVLEISAHISVHQLVQMAPFCDASVQSVQQLTQNIVGFGEQLPLDSAITLLQYARLLGTGTERFCAEWAPHILELPVSLFLLSQYFFAKKTNLFFSCWQRVVHEYGDAFWSVYWSEQLWRAGMYLSLKSQHKDTEAKQIAYRLPFSFINTDWRNHTVNECRNAHQFLYDYDYRLKTSNSATGFELFFTKFFTNQFATK